MNSRYDDDLAQAIYEGRAKTAGPVSVERQVPWPADRKERAKLEHNGGNAEMDLAIGCAKEVRSRENGK